MCGSRPRNPAAALAGASARTVMLLPLNVTMTLPSELEGPSDRGTPMMMKRLEILVDQMNIAMLGRPKRARKPTPNAGHVELPRGRLRETL